MGRARGRAAGRQRVQTVQRAVQMLVQRAQRARRAAPACSRTRSISSSPPPLPERTSCAAACAALPRPAGAERCDGQPGGSGARPGDARRAVRAPGRSPSPAGAALCEAGAWRRCHAPAWRRRAAAAAPRSASSSSRLSSPASSSSSASRSCRRGEIGGEVTAGERRLGGSKRDMCLVHVVLRHAARQRHPRLLHPVGGARRRLGRRAAAAPLARRRRRGGGRPRLTRRRRRGRARREARGTGLGRHRRRRRLALALRLRVGPRSGRRRREGRAEPRCRQRGAPDRRGVAARRHRGHNRVVRVRGRLRRCLRRRGLAAEHHRPFGHQRRHRRSGGGDRGGGGRSGGGCSGGGGGGDGGVGDSGGGERGGGDGGGGGGGGALRAARRDVRAVSGRDEGRTRARRGVARTGRDAVGRVGVEPGACPLDALVLQVERRDGGRGGCGGGGGEGGRGRGGGGGEGGRGLGRRRGDGAEGDVGGTCRRGGGGGLSRERRVAVALAEGEHVAHRGAARRLSPVAAGRLPTIGG